MADIKYTNRSSEEVSDDFKEILEKKVLSAIKLGPSIQEVEIILTESENPSRGGDSHKIDISISGTGDSYNATARSSSFEGAIDSVISKVRRQLRKAKEERTVSKSGHRKPLSFDGVS